MTNPPLPITRSPAESWAEVRARDQVMRYRRSGAGVSVLLLRPAGDPDALWPELVRALGEGFKVIEPELSPPSNGASFTDLLADFLEGLGVSKLRIVAAGRFCLPALELALCEGDRIDRIVLVPEGNGRMSELDGALRTASCDAGVPLLVVRRGQPASESVPHVACFLRDGDGKTP